MHPASAPSSLTCTIAAHSHVQSLLARHDRRAWRAIAHMQTSWGAFPTSYLRGPHVEHVLIQPPSLDNLETFRRRSPEPLHHSRLLHRLPIPVPSPHVSLVDTPSSSPVPASARALRNHTGQPHHLLLHGSSPGSACLPALGASYSSRSAPVHHHGLYKETQTRSLSPHHPRTRPFTTCR
jgi:hypothetical protein